MPPPRVFVESLSGPERCRLPEDEARHVRARRLEPGAELVVFDGSGRWAAGILHLDRGNRLEIEIGEVQIAPVPSPKIVVGVSAIRLPRLSWLIEKATELHASAVTIVDTARAQGERTRLAAAELSRLNRLALEACKQCGSLRAPRIGGPVPAGEFLREPADVRIVLDPEGDPFPGELAGESVLLWAGPEGGFDDAERRSIVQGGWVPIRLPGGTLRAETAAIAGLVLASRAFDSARLRGRQ